MIRKTKNNKLKTGDIFAVELADKKTWSIVQLCYIFETDDYFSLTFGLFNIRENSFDDIQNVDNYHLSEPIFIATLDENPKKWKHIGNRPVEYSNVDVEKGITGTWGWYNKAESGIYPKLEAYFGILPYDLYLGKAHIENYLVNKDILPNNIRLLKDFTKEEAEQKGILTMLKYYDRENELKK